MTKPIESADPKELRIEYIPLEQAAKWDWDDNPKLHDSERLMRSIEKYGFQDPPKFDAALGGFAHGNGRTRALAEMKRRGLPLPFGIVEVDGDWAMPVLFGNDMESRDVATAYAIDHNNLTMAGGDYTILEVARMWDTVLYGELLVRAKENGVLPVTVKSHEIDEILSGGWDDVAGDWDSYQDLEMREVANDADTQEKPNVQFKIGPYVWHVPRLVFTKWLDEARLEVGFKHKDLIQEYERRLGL
jgi:hypothetical protein